MIGALALAATLASLLVLSTRLSGEPLLEERIGLALALGPVLLAWTSYGAALVLGIGPLSAALAGVLWLGAVVAAVAVDRRRILPRLRDDVRFFRHRFIHGGHPAVALALCATILLWIAAAVLQPTLIERTDGAILTGTALNLGDAPLHLAISHGFAFGENVPPENVIFSGTRLAYPFIPDFLTGLLITTGWTSGAATWLPSMLCLCGCLLLLACLAYRASGIWLAAIIAPLLVAFAGGGQFLGAALGAALRGGSVSGGWQWAATQSAADWNIQWKTPLIALFATQRSTVFGLALIAAALFLLWIAFEERGGEGRTGIGPRERRLLIAAGALMGLLPLVFSHGLLALATMLPLIFAVAPRRFRWAWPLPLLAATLLALPQLLWLQPALSGSRFIRWEPGWLSPTIYGIGWFWLKNLGPLLPLAVVASLARRRLGLIRADLWGAAWCPFLVASLFALAPWAWDNTKLFVVWLAVISIPVSALLARWLRSGPEALTASLILLIWLLGSGLLQVHHVLFREGDHLEYTPERTRLALELREASAPDAIVAERPHYAQLAFLAGRRSFMGYPGHLWSYGIDYGEREVELRSLYRSLSNSGGAEPDGLLRELVERHGIDYVVVGPEEEEFCRCDLPGSFPGLRLVASAGDESLYATAGPRGPE